MAKRIDVDRLIRLSKRGAPVVDVLPRSVYLREHLPGAVSVPLETFRPEDVDDFDRAKPLVVYCFDQH